MEYDKVLIDIYNYTYNEKKRIRSDRSAREKMIAIFNNLSNFDARKLDNPIWIGMKLTNICNLRCLHCWTENDFYEPSTEDIKTAIDKLSAANIKFIGFSGGEIFLREDIMEIIKYAKDKKMVLELFTNGTMITDQYIVLLSELLDKNVDVVQVSLDGLTNKSMNAQRGINSVDIINRIKKMVNADINIRVSYVATHMNVNELYDTYREMANCGVKGFSVSPVYPKAKGKEIFHKLNMSDYYMQIHKCINEKSDMELVYFLQIDFFNEIEKYDKVGFENIKLEYQIPSGYDSMYISAYGDVYPEFLLEYPELRLGNIFNDNLETIYDKRSKTAISVPRSLKGTKCEKCKFVSVCIGHSYQQVYETYSDFNYPNPNCKIGDKNVKVLR